jgi:hypothetical protein
MNFLGLEGKGIDDWARQEDFVKPGPEPLTVIVAGPRDGRRNIPIREFAAWLLFSDHFSVGRYRRGMQHS